MKYDIGIIGGGQLGQMMAIEAKKMGKTVAALDPNPKCPASLVCDKIIVGSYSDLDKLKELGDITNVLSYEFENVPGETLIHLDKTYNIPQGINILLDSQDRLSEKMNAQRHGLKTARFKDCSSLIDLKNAIKEFGYPCIYKTRREGYDGHGQVVLRSENDIELVKPYLDSVLGIVEEFIDFDYEVSIIMIRNEDKIIHFPISRNIHKDGILNICYVSESEQEKYKDLISASYNFMRSANYMGILTIEYFIKDNEFYFNEMAPRPHNSGHYTIEGCNTNQFRELDKFLLNLDLETPKIKKYTIMKNILGRDLCNLEKLKLIPNASVHMYGKDEVRMLRKLGHITYVGLNLHEFINYLKKLNIEE